jgi:gamma-glutamyltranspeptidase/glutathione hydrolase/leukotriene-C4 hydrolase
MVSADSSRCSDVGTDILAAGGNAVDAAVATTLCQGVVNPVASGIGGGAFIMIRWANGSAEFINARETAPAAANATMYNGEDIGLRKLGAPAAGLQQAVLLFLQYACWSTVTCLSVWSWCLNILPCLV